MYSLAVQPLFAIANCSKRWKIMKLEEDLNITVPNSKSYKLNYKCTDT